MLDQVVVPRTMNLRVLGQCPYRIQLMVAGENHRLLGLALDTLFSNDGLFLDVQMDEPSKDVHQAVARKNLAPQVSPFVVPFCGGLRKMPFIAVISAENATLCGSTMPIMAPIIFLKLLI